MKKAIVRFLAWFGAGVILYSIYFAIMLSYKGSIPSKTILEINLDSQMIEDAPDSAVAKYMLSDRPRVRDIVDALDRGAKDDRVVGLVATIASVPTGMAEAQEVRDAVLRFRPGQRRLLHRHRLRSNQPPTFRRRGPHRAHDRNSVRERHPR